MTHLLPFLAFLVLPLLADRSRGTRSRPRRTFRRPGLSAAPESPYQRVVIIDDDPAITSLVCSILQDAHLEAVACHQSSEAFDCVKAHQPHMILLDVQMPEVNGVQVYQRLQSDPETSAIPVIFVSANAGILKPHLSQFNALGVRLLYKPFTSDELLAMVGTVLRIEHDTDHHGHGH